MKNNRYKVSTTDELDENGSRLIEEVNGREIAIFRINDNFYAIANYCVHQAGPLCEGKITGKTGLADDGWDWSYEKEGEIIACPWHYWQFDIKSGENIKDDTYRIPTYDIEVDDGDIYVIY